MTLNPTIAVAQIGAEKGNLAKNLESVQHWLREAAEKKIDLVVFPECALSGYMFDSRAACEAAAVSLQGPEVGALLQSCAALGIEAVVGLLEQDGDKLYNTAVVIGPQGIIGAHRKRHLPHLGADRFVDIPDSTALSLFDTKAGRVGVAICYEIRFPEIARGLALAGADILALPTNWPVQSVLLAESFTRVRAAENFVYLLAANRPDAEGDATFLGKSTITSPLGEVLANAETREGLVQITADLNRARDKTITFKAGDFELAPFRDRIAGSYHLD